MTEAELEREVLALAAKRELRVLSIPDSRRLITGTGYPDLTIAGRRGVLWRELKTEGGQLSADQRRWKYQLLASGQNWGVWRPRDLAAGEVAAQLDLIR
jgi:hypothetical protein